MDRDSKKLEKPLSALRRKAEAAFEKAVNFFNDRNPREKVMVVILAAFLVIFLDYWVLINPVVRVFRNTLPDLAIFESELKSSRDDQANQDGIQKEWLAAKQAAAEKEKSFVAPDELPALLENLSKLALESGVKILSLKTGATQEAGNTHRYATVSIRLSALAGAHELGSFLSKLESNRTYFKVLDLKIAVQQADFKRHLVDAILQVCQRAG